MVNPIYFIYNAKWHEVQDYLIFPGQQPYISTVSPNNKWFNKLSAKKQTMIRKAIKAADKAAFEYQIHINSENMVKIREERPDLKVIVLNEEERGQFIKLSKSLRNTYFDVVANAYPEDEKAAARQDAKSIIDNLEKEIKAASENQL